MLFNSYPFILGFLPVVLIGFFAAARHSRFAGAAWLAGASLFFYGWWSIQVLPLLLFSIAGNYLVSSRLAPADNPVERSRRLWLIGALAANLALLAFFKYANFFIDNANALLTVAHRPPIQPLDIVLPIGISFYTFTQIAFLVDCWQGKVRERNFVHYVLFVTYFPHLIAGPVLHHAQMMPQFALARTYRPSADRLAIGIMIFAIGLGKKLLIADPAGIYGDALFDRADAGHAPGLLMSWLGVLAYALQIYFDFSGYSDMAIGLSMLFNIRLPINFDSPYKSRSIIEFWRRWHISLSTFLRDYLYIPLGGNRHGKLRRYANLFATMLLGGLWHGASWNFVLWGAAHGVFLVINHAWQRLVGTERRYGAIGATACWLITFTAVCLAWVLFRAKTLAGAIAVYRGMLGLNGVSVPVPIAERFDGHLGPIGLVPAGVWQDALIPATPFAWWAILPLGLAIAVFARSSTDLLKELTERAAAGGLRLSVGRLAYISVLFAAGLLFISQHSQFLYFQF